MKVEKGDMVKVEYTIRFENGEVFDTSKKKVAKEEGVYSPIRTYEPLDVKVGAGQLVPGLDKVLIGMEKDVKKTTKLSPEEGFGERRPDLIQKMSMRSFRENNIEPREGMIVETSQGLATITRLFENKVELDFNSPMAGKTIVLDIEVIEIKKE